MVPSRLLIKDAGVGFEGLSGNRMLDRSITGVLGLPIFTKRAPLMQDRDAIESVLTPTFLVALDLLKHDIKTDCIPVFVAQLLSGAISP